MHTHVYIHKEAKDWQWVSPPSLFKRFIFISFNYMYMSICGGGLCTCDFRLPRKPEEGIKFSWSLSYRWL